MQFELLWCFLVYYFSFYWEQYWCHHRFINDNSYHYYLNMVSLANSTAFLLLFEITRAKVCQFKPIKFTFEFDHYPLEFEILYFDPQGFRKLKQVVSQQILFYVYYPSLYLPRPFDLYFIQLFLFKFDWIGSTVLERCLRHWKSSYLVLKSS